MKNLIVKNGFPLLFFIIVALLVFGSFKVFSQTYPPSCVITMPHVNSYFKQNSDIVIKVYSTDFGKTTNNGTVTKVEFYNGNTKLGEATTHTNYTYTFTWKCVPAGKYTLKAVATNNRNVSFTSAGVVIHVGTANVTPRGMSANKGKYLANIIAGSVQTKYLEYWNGVTSENGCKWGTVEGTRNQMNWSQADVAYNYAANNNLMFRYHAIAWGSQYPSWLDGLCNDVTTFRKEIEDYMKAIKNRYEYIDQIDVLNENLYLNTYNGQEHQAGTPCFRSGLGGKGTTGYDWVIWLFSKAREHFPNSKLVMNDFELENNSAGINEMLDVVKVLRDRGLIDGFGTQAHYFNINNLSATQLKNSLDQMDNGGVPVYVTELDINGSATEQNTRYNTLFPVYWDHPAVAGITLWGYVEGTTWADGTGIITSNGTEKAAMQTIKTFVNGKPNVGYPFGTITGTCCATPAPTVAETSYTYKIGDVATQLSATGTSLKWYNVTAGTTLTSAPTPSTTTAGVTVYGVTQTANGCESSPTNITVTVYKPQSPYGGTPHPIPGKIEFEYFDEGGQDTA
ncbi:MAG: endo-1,4-beta-xylanase, partial [Bacteroidales bacterium]